MRAILTGAFLAAMLSAAQAQDACFPVKAITEALAKKLGQKPLIFMMTNGGIPAVIFVNAKTGTWTEVQFGPEVGCITGMGDSLEVIAQGQKV